MFSFLYFFIPKSTMILGVDRFYLTFPVRTGTISVFHKQVTQLPEIRNLYEN